jgi:hypothetical protein
MSVLDELEPVEMVAGQVPLPLMPEEGSLFRLRPVRRPDGRFYRPRKAPAALLLFGCCDDDVTAITVMRTHDIGRARTLAMRALFEYDPTPTWVLHPPELHWGRWRPDRATDGQTWVGCIDGRTGTPAVFFDVEWGP